MERVGKLASPARGLGGTCQANRCGAAAAKHWLDWLVKPGVSSFGLTYDDSIWRRSRKTKLLSQIADAAIHLPTSRRFRKPMVSRMWHCHNRVIFSSQTTENSSRVPAFTRFTFEIIHDSRANCNNCLWLDNIEYQWQEFVSAGAFDRWKRVGFNRCAKKKFSYGRAGIEFPRFAKYATNHFEMGAVMALGAIWVNVRPHINFV
jgi:hypothetical protein